MKLELDENFYIEQKGENCMLVELKDGFNKPKNKKEKPVPIKVEVPHYCGTVYQALTAYLHRTVNKAESVSDVRKRAVKAITVIEKFEQQIKDTFRCEVKVSK